MLLHLFYFVVWTLFYFDLDLKNSIWNSLVNKQIKKKNSLPSYLAADRLARRPALPRWRLGRSAWAAAAFLSSTHDTGWAGPASL
jgi:hypothetical protein